MSVADHLTIKPPTMAEVAAEREGKPLSKGVSRLEKQAAAKPLTKVTDAQFKATVWERDKGRCRRCGRKVKKQMPRDPLRGEVHHLHGRLGVLRHEDRCALLLCASDHEKVTGAVNVKVVIVATKTLEIDGRTLTDARAKVKFEVIA